MSCDRSVISIVPAEVDISIERATTNEIEFVLTDGRGEAIDITSDTVKMPVRDDYGGTDMIPVKTNAPGEHSDPTNGRTAFTIAQTEIDGETNRTIQTVWLYEIRRIQPGGSELVYIKGLLKIQPDVGAS